MATALLPSLLLAPFPLHTPRAPIPRRARLPALVSPPPPPLPPRWDAIQPALDAVPLFSVANAEGQPLQYNVNGATQALLYADVGEAKEALEKAASKFPEMTLDLVPVGLGASVALSAQGKACVVPALGELRRAGMPEGVPAMGQELPLFACTQMTRQPVDGAEGEEVLPLFLSYEDCEAAVAEVREAADGELPSLEIIGLSLPGVVEHLASIEEGAPTPFSFVPPSSSTHHVSEYLGNGLYARVVDEE